MNVLGRFCKAQGTRTSEEHVHTSWVRLGTRGIFELSVPVERVFSTNIPI